jgi:hypothetical protein
MILQQNVNPSLDPIQALLQLSTRGGIFSHEQQSDNDAVSVLRISYRITKKSGRKILHLLRGAGNGCGILPWIPSLLRPLQDR